MTVCLNQADTLHVFKVLKLHDLTSFFPRKESPSCATDTYIHAYRQTYSSDITRQHEFILCEASGITGGIIVCPISGLSRGSTLRQEKKRRLTRGKKKKKSPIHEIRVGVHLDECNGRG